MSLAARETEHAGLDRVSRVRRLVAAVRMMAPAWFLERALRRILPSRYVEVHWFTMFEQWADALDMTKVGIPGMRWATADDIDSSRSLGFSPEICRRLFARGARARVLEEDGRIVGYAWTEIRTAEQKSIRFVLAPSERYLTILAVVPDRRGEGLHQSLSQDTKYELARTEGCERFLSVIDNLNRNSMRSVRKIPGMRALGKILVLRAGNRCFIRDKAGVLIPADGRPRRKRWVARSDKLRARVGPGKPAPHSGVPCLQG